MRYWESPVQWCTKPPTAPHVPSDPCAPRTDARDFIHFGLKLSQVLETRNPECPNARERSLGVFLNALGTCRTQCMGCESGAAWLTVAGEKRLQTTRSHGPWAVFTWLLTRRRTYIKGVRLQGGIQIFYLCRPGSLSQLLPSILGVKKSHVQHVNKCIYRVLTSPTVIFEFHIIFFWFYLKKKKH